ncbi:pyrrolysine--tRNA(Pyl) ligase small subunit [Desulfosporosinus meridiei]|uniref:Pyrrolysyl-tRNA synthetase, N-terminal region n=1 Tax=Desulfosporosinus meridiei (strain ATCC BAA-275 / DSM 13257 / KCTC 12902 / NCIMB 13706 / S10) TaxID=768704 RepID=J7IPM4_DESMD|nr:pyrrolysine--tRNA(Pyl) ligase small subunit [Desulfosporosinus meridiei]AFQ43575.1 pyrrolysyl-tRNA synthetase, N-terminal region [Desulfosporosinus meridiei DSM 13257]
MTADATKKKRYYRKNVDFFKFVEKLKLWPSRSGTLHGVKSMTIRGNTAEIVTHCNEKFQIYNSKHSRAARCLRNKLFFRACTTCKIPGWKLEKYSSTHVNQNYGSRL